MGFLCVRATELAGRVPRPEGNCVDSRLHVGFHVLDGIGSDILPSIHTPAVPACWSTGGSFYFPVEELARWLEVYNILLEKVAGL